MATFRLPVLKEFGGKVEEWDSWSRKLKACLTSMNPLYAKLFRVAETAAEIINDDSFTEGHEEEEKLSRELHGILVQLCGGPSEVLLQQIDTDHGCEDWRKLHEYYKRPSLSTSLGRLVKILDYPFKKMEEDLMKWEGEVAAFERETGSPLPSMVKIAVLIKQSSGPLQQHLQLNANHTTSYNQVRETVLNYTNAQANAFKFESSRRDDPMQVDLFGVNAFKGKGKDKGKGKGKGKDKGKGKGKGKGKDGKGPSPNPSWQEEDDQSWGTPSEGGPGSAERWCESCGKHGHTWEKCRSYPPSWSSWGGSYNVNTFDETWPSSEHDSRMDKMEKQLEKLTEMMSAQTSHPSSSGNRVSMNTVHAQMPQPTRPSPTERQTAAGRTVSGKPVVLINAFDVVPNLKQNAKEKKNEEHRNYENEEKSFKEEFLDFQTELFMDLDEKFEKLAANLKEHVGDLHD